MRAWERWDRFPDGPPDGWLFRVAFNLANSRWRRRSAERRALARHGPGRDVAADPDASDRVAVRDALAGLGPRQRAVVVLRFYAQLSVAETAAALTCAEGTVKSTTAQALAVLRRSLTIDEEREDHADAD